MREKKLWLVITFHTTAAAIAMEKLCRAKGLPGRLIPVPRELTADCGMSWRAEVQDRAALAALTEAEGLEVAEIRSTSPPNFWAEQALHSPDMPAPMTMMS